MYAESSYDDHDNYDDDYTHVDLVHKNKQKISSK